MTTPTGPRIPQGTDPRPNQRPDASMTLLTEMMQRPLDPSYAAEAERRRGAGLAPARPRLWRLALAAFVIGLLLATSARVLRQPKEAVAGQKAALIAQITSRQQAADALARQQTTLRAQIQATQKQALADEARTDLAERLAHAQTVAGTTAVSGPGLVLTIDNAPRAAGQAADDDPRAKTTQDAGTVVASDLQTVVNALWGAGAEAISINGQRLTSTSAIRFAGDAILVDYRPLARPYVVTAIGDGESFEKAFVASPGGKFLQDLADENGVVYERSRKDAVTCPAGSTAALRHARAVTATAAPAAPASLPSTSVSTTVSTTTESAP